MATDKNELDLFVDHQLEVISPFKAKSIDLKIDADLAEVTDDATAKQAGDLRKQITKHQADTKEARLTITRQIDAVTKKFIAAENDALTEAVEAQTIIQKKLIDYEEIQEAARVAEEKRVGELIDKFAVSTFGELDEVADIEVEMHQLETTYRVLSDSDMSHPQIKMAYANAKGALLQKLDEMTLGADTDDAELGELAADLEDAAEELAVTTKAAEKAAPKVGIRTKTKFEIVDASLVPRIFCAPVDALIRAAIADGTDEIPGVRIYQERGF